MMDSVKAARRPWRSAYRPSEEVADRPHQETDGEDGRRIQRLARRVPLGEELGGEIHREGRVNVPVVPFDQVADRAFKDIGCNGARLEALMRWIHR
ncbi:hypothetical protein LJK88_02485 [Paenibacillus sp. P26]|nr:hypothetical protein LJK88_02485 [Paenibacillus sp. P26]